MGQYSTPAHSRLYTKDYHKPTLYTIDLKSASKWFITHWYYGNHELKSMTSISSDELKTRELYLKPLIYCSFVQAVRPALGSWEYSSAIKKHYLLLLYTNVPKNY